MLHVIRDCIVARNTWVSIDPSLVQSDFFHANMSDWLEANLSHQTRMLYGTPWPLFLRLLVRCYGNNESIYI